MDERIFQLSKRYGGVLTVRGQFHEYPRYDQLEQAMNDLLRPGPLRR
jgi:predicted secreted protein